MRTNYISPFWVLFALLILINYSGICFGKLNFRLERLCTDYNGVIYDGKTVLAYGKYGIITYSTDQGKTWNQISLDEQLDILKMIIIKNNLYALTPYSILKSTGNPLDWYQKKLFDEPILKDFTFDENYIYLACSNAIYRINLDLKSELETIALFDEFTSISEIAYLKNYLFFIDGNYYLNKLNLQTNTIDTIDLHQNVLSNVTEVRNISHLKVYNSTIYLLAESIFQNSSQHTQPENADNNIRHYLLRTDDLGINWSIVTSNIRLTKEYQIFDGTIYFLTHKGIKNSSTFDYYYTIRFFKINPDGTEEEINKDEILQHRIPVFTGGLTDVSIPNSFWVNMFARVDSNILIAVGPNKTILRSTNYGRTWSLISYFKSIGEERQHRVKFIGTDTIIVFNSVRPYFFKSFDGGVTFLPPKRNVENFPENGGELLIWNDNTFGFIEWKPYSHAEKINDSTYVTKYDSTYFYFYITTDLGERFSKNGFYRKHIFTSDSLFYRLEKVAVIQNKLLCVFAPIQTKPTETVFNPYFYIFDKSLNIIDSIEQNKIHYFLGDNLLIEDSIIYCLASPFLYSTKDLGRTWETLYSNFEGYNYLKLRFKNLLFISHWKQIGTNKYETKLLSFNLSNYAVDTLLLSGLMNFFVLNDTLFAYIRDTKYLFFFPFATSNLAFYDSTEVITSSNENPNFIVDAVTNSKEWYFVILKENGSGFFNKLYEINLAKIIYEEPKYLPVDFQIDNNIVYFFNFPPYPMPAREYLTTLLFWDLPYIASDIKIAIYNQLGTKLDGVKITIEQIDTCNGALKINCSGLPSGVYTAFLTLGNKNLLIPFVVTR